MQSALLVGLGGAIGAVSRYGFSALVGRLWQGSFPVAIFLTNVLGAVFIGVLMGLLARFAPAWQDEARLFLAVGVLGGFTTFSSFSLDTVMLIERGEIALALLYVGLSVVVCVAGLYLGLLATRGGMA
jgi:fluoride exporter